MGSEDFSERGPTFLNYALMSNTGKGGEKFCSPWLRVCILRYMFDYHKYLEWMLLLLNSVYKQDFENWLPFSQISASKYTKRISSPC